MKKIILISALLTAFPLSQAHAKNFFGELYVGSDNGRISSTNVTGPNENAAVNNIMGGARIGYALGVLIAGVDYQGSIGNLSWDNSSIKGGLWAKNMMYGVAGFDFGAVRLWGGYGVSNQMDLQMDYTTYKTDKLFTGGTCYKFGAGVRLYKKIHLEGEYYVNRPDKFQINTGQGNFGATYTRREETGITVALAFVWDETDFKIIQR